MRKSQVATAVLAALAASALAVASAGGAIAAPVSDPPPAVPAAVPVLPSVIPAWAATVKAAATPTPGTQSVYLLLDLVTKDPAGAKAYGIAASTPGNALYRHWLTKAEYDQRFGVVPGAAEAVTTELTALGVTNISTTALGNGIAAAMPASLASTIFGVGFHQLQHDGQSVRVATNEPVLPDALKPFVTDVEGLTQGLLHTDHVADRTAVRTEPAKAAAPAVAPSNCVTAPNTNAVAPAAYFNPKTDNSGDVYGSSLATGFPTYPVLAGDSSTTKPFVVKGYDPKQIRGAYGVTDVTQTGKGVTAGVVVFFDGANVCSDLDQFSTEQGLTTNFTYTDLGLATQPEGDAVDPTALGDAASEQTLDVEAIHQMAPDANIDYSGSTAPEDAAIFPAIDVLIAAGVDVINNSYGGSSDASASDVTMFADLVTTEATALGVGIDFSSGDSADDVTASGERQSDFPSTSDAVTSVGGTGIEIGAGGAYNGEFYWGTYSTPAYTSGDNTWGPLASQAGGAGGGGGVSTAYAEPDYQKLLKPDGQPIVPVSETKDADNGAAVGATSGTGITTPGRVTPDVAMIADSTTGILVGETQTPDVSSDGSILAVPPAYSYYRIGGTSVSSPIFTGMMALADQALGSSAGFVNPTLYAIDAKGAAGFRDPQIGRTATGSRLGSSAAQLLVGCSDDPTNGDATCPGSGPGVTPVVAEVRADYTDTGNDGGYTTTDADSTGLAPVITGATPGDPEIYHLRGQGVLGTLEDLPGYDDSTGLGSPYAPTFIASVASLTPPPAALPDAATPVLFVLSGLVLGSGALLLRRRRRLTA